MEKAIVIIQSRNGESKSSIIRTISQVLLGLSENTIINVGELGLQENIVSVVKIDHLSVGVGCEKEDRGETQEIIANLVDQGCDIILCAVEFDALDDEKLYRLALNNGYEITRMDSRWSEKLKVNYLEEEQVALVIDTINAANARRNLASNTSHGPVHTG